VVAGTPADQVSHPWNECTGYMRKLCRPITVHGDMSQKQQAAKAQPALTPKLKLTIAADQSASLKSQKPTRDVNINHRHVRRPAPSLNHSHTDATSGQFPFQTRHRGLSPIGAATSHFRTTTCSDRHCSTTTRTHPEDPGQNCCVCRRCCWSRNEVFRLGPRCCPRIHGALAYRWVLTWYYCTSTATAAVPSVRASFPEDRSSRPNWNDRPTGSPPCGKSP
jgi:hypothetical protein